MVGIVIVSHSKNLADSLKELAGEMGQSGANIAAAGGIDDAENPTGTDAMKILEAIQQVYSPDGVLVFMDVGSAILSTEMALDFVDDEQRPQITICEAALVEGVLAAAALAQAGAGRDEILTEVRQALPAKQAQLGFTPPGYSAPAEAQAPQPGKHLEKADLKAEFTLKNTMGLHARPAAKLAQTVTGRQAEVYIRNLSRKADFVSAKSMNSLMALNAQQNDTVELTFSGPEAQQVHDEVAEMMRSHFGEPTIPKRTRRKSQSPSATPAPHGELTGIPIAPGYATGPVHHYSKALPDVSELKQEDSRAEHTKLMRALEKAEQEIKTIKTASLRDIGEQEAAIFDAQIMLLKDPELLKTVEKSIEEGYTASYAWRSKLNEVVEMYKQITGDSVNSTRVIDLVDIGTRVLEKLDGKQFAPLELTEPGILCMDDISPSDAAGLHREMVLAICCESGSDVSHSAIIARSLGIPTIFNLGESLRELKNGQQLAVDAEVGKVYTKPDQALIEHMQRLRSKWLEMQQKAHAGRKSKGQTSDGTTVQVLANVGNEHEINQVLDMGAEGVGLFRTEFLFMAGTRAPDEEEQFTAYKTAAQALGKQCPLVIRTLDAGGDKPVPYLHIGKEENPFLGRRGIRYCLEEPELFKKQLRALLRASVFGQLYIMFPMISEPGELKQALKLLQECRHQLQQNGQPYDDSLTTGIMIEVPSAVECLDQLLPLVDFISVGTNDLAQYLMGADRTNASVAPLASYFQPAVLRVVERIIHKANESATKVSLCGEMARNPLVAPLLLAYGLREFSLSAAGIPELKYTIRKLHMARLSELPQQIRSCESPEEVRSILRAVQEATSPLPESLA